MDNIKETIGSFDLSSIDLDKIIEFIRKAIDFINGLIAKIVALGGKADETA